MWVELDTLAPRRGWAQAGSKKRSEADPGPHPPTAKVLTGSPPASEELITAALKGCWVLDSWGRRLLVLGAVVTALGPGHEQRDPRGQESWAVGPHITPVNLLC